MNRNRDMVLPFYGGSETRMFEIERRCMDRDGVVVRYLDEALPDGFILDVGAGNGFVASLLCHDGRTVVPLEPDPKMIDAAKPLLWSCGVAQEIPFHDDAFHGAYATWVFFLPGLEGRDTGLSEVLRVVREDGPIVIVDNAGDDEFSSLANRPISDDGSWYAARGFERTVLNTSFRFHSIAEAQKLLSLYFGPEAAASVKSAEIEFRVAAYLGFSGAFQNTP